ncbi:adhesion G-protein coupled receptor G6-like isoform X2 [Thunnus maccoyii]|uniref:adhesion G-protein coupled receptor G6-like isoform X2 n=1 Tax=Thunnus maccoyii TaxID=8240 RepID=UPI001C4C389A|nr:adhesion G-protein coupled receptor G6-like isoform X2 [Thunnus maccoyii]
MTQKSWMTWVLLMCLLWICPIFKAKGGNFVLDYKNCPPKQKIIFIVADNFNGLIGRKQNNLQIDNCIIFLQKNASKLTRRLWGAEWPQMDDKNDSLVLRISKWHIKKKNLCVLNGTHCNATVSQLKAKECSAQKEPNCVFSQMINGSCHARCLDTETVCEKSTYNEDHCKKMDTQNRWIKDKYIINFTRTGSHCLNCNNPVKKPERTINLKQNVTVDKKGKLDPAQAVKIVNNIPSIVPSFSESSAELNAGGGVTGAIVKKTEPEDVDEVSFAYLSPNDSMNIIDSRDFLSPFSRSVTVSKQAFEKAIDSNVSEAFAAVLRFNNMAQDELNSTVLGDEVIAIEMGVAITNLTDKISINFRNLKYEGIPSCRSWNGEGNQPNWTDDGCETIQDGDNITCRCSHLTFFAILLAPLNETISSSDLNTLTIITQIGCGLSMFFLGIVLFMHFFMRKTKTSKTTWLLIHLVSAMFLLNLTFLINSVVAKMKNSVGCKIMAAFMHYFMLATFTWFAVQAFHLCLQLYTRGNISIHRYILKVSVTSWVLPSVVVIVLFILGKYGEQVIHTDNTENNEAMCWITDSDVHYIVNIGYYVLVFLFTFTTFIIMLSWLFCLKRTKAGNVQMSRNGKNIVTILGLCCMLGITWGFAFFAYGALRIPSYYIFTALNSFQGFFLFIYHYNTRQWEEVNIGVNKNPDNISSISTLNTSLGNHENPYTNQPGKK